MRNVMIWLRKVKINRHYEIFEFIRIYGNSILLEFIMEIRISGKRA